MVVVVLGWWLWWKDSVLWEKKVRAIGSEENIVWCAVIALKSVMDKRFTGWLSDVILCLQSLNPVVYWNFLLLLFDEWTHYAINIVCIFYILLKVVCIWRFSIMCWHVVTLSYMLHSVFSSTLSRVTYI